MSFFANILWAVANLLSVGFGFNEKMNDSLLLAKTNTRLAITSTKLENVIVLRTITKKSLLINKVYLLFDGARLIEPPDGVYEVYITVNLVNTVLLTEKSLFFAGVIDTYALQKDSRYPKTHTGLNITRNILSFHKDKNIVAHQYFITVLFRGNIRANGKASTNAGKLIIERMRMVSVN